jgi:cold shock CspA family protein
VQPTFLNSPSRKSSTEMRSRGWVAQFDDAAGFGYIHAIKADSEVVDAFFFHCTRLADGSRSVEPGAIVNFLVVPGHLGTWEAVEIEVVGQPTGAPEAPAEGQIACPVCSGQVDGPSGAYEICEHCGWEDDPTQRDDPNFAGGANTMSLAAARDDWARRNAIQPE